MATFHAQCTPIRRAAGRTAVAAAAYRAGCALVNDRTGVAYDYTEKGGVIEAKIFTPHGDIVDRQTLWSAAENAEKRSDSRTAREWEISLPHELSAEERRACAHEFSQWLVNRYGVAVDCALHAPSKEGDQRNWHAHVLMTTRQISADGKLIDKAECELGDTELRRKGMSTGREQIIEVRQQWERIANGALERAGRPERIDHRSHKDRELPTVPTIHMGAAAMKMEREGIATLRGNTNREIIATNGVITEKLAELAEVYQLEDARKKRDAEREAKAANSPEAAAARRAARLVEIESERAALKKQIGYRPAGYATVDMKTAQEAIVAIREKRVAARDDFARAEADAAKWREAHPIRAFFRLGDAALVAIEERRLVAEATDKALFDKERHAKLTLDAATARGWRVWKDNNEALKARENRLALEALTLQRQQEPKRVNEPEQRRSRDRDDDYDLGR